MSSASRWGDAKLPTFLAANNLKPFISLDLAASLTSPIEYVPIHGGRSAYGFKAELVPKICNVWLAARDAKVLTPSQERTAAVADLLTRGLAETAIVALVDEATGYQDVRAKDALAKILEAFIAKEIRGWARTFPVEFYKEMFRLRGLPFNGTVKRPQYIGKLTNNIVYERLAPRILEELDKVNPSNDKGRRPAKHHQWLTENMGYQKLLQHLDSVVTLMKVADNWDHFKTMLDKAKPIEIPSPLFDELDDKDHVDD